MKQLNVMNINFVTKAIIAGFDTASITRNWNGINELEFELNAEVTNANLLDLNDIVWFDNETHKAFIIERKEEVLTGDCLSFRFHALGLSSILRDFITVPPDLAYDIATGTRESVIRSWVTTNCITRLPQYPIVLGDYKSFGGMVTEQTRYKNLFDEIVRVLSVDDLSFRLSLDIEHKRFVFDVLEGEIKSVIFGLEYGNLAEYQKVSDESSSKNIAYIGGQGEGLAREISIVDWSSTMSRIKETFVDARDVKTLAELPERGGQQLTQMIGIESFQFEALERQFRYQVDYDLGDYVTIVISKSMSPLMQVKSVKEIYERGQVRIIPSFGSTEKNLSGLLKNLNQRISCLEKI